MRHASVSDIRFEGCGDRMSTRHAMVPPMVVAVDTSLAEVLEHTVAADMPLHVPA